MHISGSAGEHFGEETAQEALEAGMLDRRDNAFGFVAVVFEEQIDTRLESGIGDGLYQAHAALDIARPDCVHSCPDLRMVTGTRHGQIDGWA